MWVFDATPLIYLARVDRLEVIEGVGRNCLVPERVYHEIVTTGLEAGYPDTRRVERVVDAGHADVTSVEETEFFGRLRSNSNLSAADISVLACAAEHDGTPVMDERYGRDVADAEGVPTRGTAFLVLSAVRRGVISPSEARETIDAMVDEGWYCAPDVYAMILRKLESFP